MNNVFDLSIIMPVLAIITTFVILVMLIVVNFKTKETQNTTINQKSFEELAHELKADNAILKSELTNIKETLNSINNLMEEI